MFFSFFIHSLPVPVSRNVPQEWLYFSYGGINAKSLLSLSAI